MADWYYIGHYGQLGPLTRDQIDELIEGGVISHETYVWRAGMTNWRQAADLDDLRQSLSRADIVMPPPPPPIAAPPLARPQDAYSSVRAYADQRVMSIVSGSTAAPSFYTLRSDRSRITGGLLQIIPGMGRMYLGYGGYGALQLVLACFGFGVLWSWIDGIIILSGGLRFDGYGRELAD